MSDFDFQLSKEEEKARVYLQAIEHVKKLPEYEGQKKDLNALRARVFYWKNRRKCINRVLDWYYQNHPKK